MTSSQRTPVLQGSADPLDGGTRLAHAGSRRGRIHGERGAAAVEFAIVATLFFMLVFGIIDFGFGFHSWNAIENAAREGARVGATDAGPKVTDIGLRVQNGTSFLTGPVTTVVTRP